MQALLLEARRYSKLGYKVGLTLGKSLVDTYQDNVTCSKQWDGISIILEDIVCVDFDDKMSMDLGYGYDLPPTLKESSPRGWHLFYAAPLGGAKRVSKIKWKPHVDLLTSGRNHIRYGGSIVVKAHALCSPSDGYKRIYPDNIPERSQLTPAPNWLVDAVKE